MANNHTLVCCIINILPRHDANNNPPPPPPPPLNDITNEEETIDSSPKERQQKKQTTELNIMDVMKIEKQCDEDESCQSLIDTNVNQLVQEATTNVEATNVNAVSGGVSYLVSINKDYEATKTNLSNVYNSFLDMQQHNNDNDDITTEEAGSEVTGTASVAPSLSELLSIQSYNDYKDVQQLESIVQQAKHELTTLNKNNDDAFQSIFSQGYYASSSNAFSCDATTPMKYNDTMLQAHQDKYIPYYDKEDNENNQETTHYYYYYLASIITQLKSRIQEFSNENHSINLLSNDALNLFKLNILNKDITDTSSSECLNISFITSLYEIGQEAYDKQLNVSFVLSNAITHLHQHSALDSFTFATEDDVVPATATATLVKKDAITIHLYSLLSSVIDTPLTKVFINKLDGVADVLGGHNSVIDAIIDKLSEGDSYESEDDEGGTSVSQSVSSVSKNTLEKTIGLLDWLESKNEHEKTIVLNGKSGILRDEMVNFFSILLYKVSY